MKTRYLFVLVLIILFICVIGQITIAEEPIKLITASATSSSDDSLPVIDLLDVNKKGSWKPKALDFGVNEGLFFQFQKPVTIDWIEIEVNGKSNGFGIDYYLDGKRNPPVKGKTKKRDQEESINNVLEYGASYQKINNNNFIIVLGAQHYGEPIEPDLYLSPLNAKVESVFLRISYAKAQAKILAVRFYRGNRKKPLIVEIPKSVSGNVTATSTLLPTTAYHVLNLFDSRLEFAWATNGKQTNGIGESYTINLDNPQDLSGLLIWNGYQRSETHYYANARPAKIKIKTDTGEELDLTLKDKMGGQFASFSKPVENIKTLKVTIESVYPGKTYKDMVISELKLIDKMGLVVIVNTPSLKIEATNSELQRALDYSLEPYMLGILDGKKNVPEYYSSGFEASYEYPHKSIRFRSNGSFVCYLNDGIMEGNWEPVDKGVRIFGKKYYTNPFSSIYLQEVKSNTAVKIFQETITMIDLTKISFSEAKKFFKPILVERRFYDNFSEKSISAIWWMGIEPYGKANITGKSEDELVKKALETAIKQKAFLLSSPLLTDLFIPSVQTEQTYEFEP